MQFITLFIIIIIKIKIYSSNPFIVNNHYEYISISDLNREIDNYNLHLVPPENNIYFETYSNIISQINNIFYFLSYNDTKWKDELNSLGNFFTIYFEDLETFYLNIEIILKDNKLQKKIKQIIIGCDSSFDKNELDPDIFKTDIKIYINKDKNKIKEKYALFNSKVFCSTYIYFSYSGDVYTDNIVISLFIFIIIFSSFWFYIHNKAKRNNKYLFIHSYMLAIFIFYFFHTLFYLIITMKKKGKYFDEDIYSGALYNIFSFFQFFTKLLPAICATLQLNLFELREHFRIIRNSKIVHILSANTFFIISLENDNEELSEILNGLLYILIVICLFYMFIQFKNCLDEKIIEAIIDEPENVPTLKYKKNLLYIHSSCIFAYTIFYFIILLISRNKFPEYRTTKFILVMINYSDLFLILLLCGIYFPRQLPPQYIEENNLDAELDINNEGNDYFENIYAFNQMDEEKYFETYKPGDSSIVIVENPFNENKIEVEIEQEETEEEEDEEEKEKDNFNDKQKDNINENKNDKNDNHIETTEEDSNDNKKDNINIINNNEDDEINNKENENKNDNGNNHNENNENEIIDSNQNSEEERNGLVSKEEENVNILNKSCLEEDILDLTHTKLGYIEI